MRGRLVDMVKRHCYKEGDFLLSSGKRSSYYLDIKDLFIRPGAMRYIADKLVVEALKTHKKINGVAAVPIGGIPFASLVSSLVDAPLIITREEKKGHGSGVEIRGLEEHEKPLTPIILMEDVVTTGRSALKAISRLAYNSLDCSTVIYVADRLEGAGELLAAHNVLLLSLLTITDLKGEPPMT